MSDTPQLNQDNQAKRSSPIQAYCTVDPKHLERDGEELICHKCSRRLMNLDKTSAQERARLVRAGKFICGFASSLALASCASKREMMIGSVAHYKHDMETDTSEPIPVPGIALQESPCDYPKAQAVPGKEGFVISPYGGHEVDISRVPNDGGMVIDPKYPEEQKKFFRLP